MEALIGFFLHLFILVSVRSEIDFVHNGFLQANLSLDGAAYLRSNGLLVITNDSTMILGHAIYPSPLQFKKTKDNNNKSTVLTFSTNFVFSIVPKYSDLGGHGLAFVLVSTKQLNGCLPNRHLGLPYDSTTNQFTTRILAIEFDTVQSSDFQDINDNHVGIDISSLVSNISKPAACYNSTGNNNNNSIFLKSGHSVQAWVDYNSQEMLINVSISPLGIPKPYRPLISYLVDLSLVLDNYMYTGFSASTGAISAMHNVHGWSFRIGGRAQELDPMKLPSLSTGTEKVVQRKGFALGITLAGVTIVILVISGALHVLHKIRNENEILEDWEIEYGAHRFKYSELFSATRGFLERNLVGSRGFGKVYRGVIPNTGLEVPIKRVAQDSNQGMKEFVAEITSMGRLRHQNLVRLHGWCRRQDVLLLVYDYVPWGSLDKLFFDNDHRKKKILTWEKRFKILIGVAQALLYLHEECEQRVVHRDVKPSNVLIDANLDARLGDFGLARTYEHGINPQTTHIVGTLGYMAPELTRIGKATTSTDVHVYGILMLEVACGRRQLKPQKNAVELLLVDWVRELHSKEEITRAVDPTLNDYILSEVKLVLTHGLLCSHPHPNYRPSIRRIVQFLLGDANLPPLPPDIHLQFPGAMMEHWDISPDDSDPSSCRMTSSMSNSSTSYDKKVSDNPGTRVTF
uniref:non-specific serine/threonine protein kinase n=1 Tax=Fagus sylvatica TaxID=28930 RepID=A0A2N9FAS1_FAGSY